MTAVSAYFFDMDHTLADNDCDVSWKQFLVGCGVAGSDALSEAGLFFDQYRRGDLDIPRFVSFQLREFTGRTPAEMAPLAARHFAAMVRPRIYPEGRNEVGMALATGRPVALLTATNEVIAAPFAAALGIPHLLATRLAMSGGKYTGDVAGAYCGGVGKIEIARRFCAEHALDFAGSCYYGDALADIPLLSEVAFPVVCNPGPELESIAARNLWPVRHFARGSE